MSNKRKIKNRDKSKSIYDLDDGSINDPIMRCIECQSIITAEHIRTEGSCWNCNGKKVRQVNTIKPEEMAELEKKGIDPEFLLLFEANSKAGGIE
jgi:hypothetical protein